MHAVLSETVATAADGSFFVHFGLPFGRKPAKYESPGLPIVAGRLRARYSALCR